MVRGLVLIFLLSTILISCVNNDQEIANLKAKILEIQDQLDNAYKPGYGSIMLNMQSRHTKLWYAGSNQNWELAEFALEEIEEAIADIKKYQSEKEETKYIDMLIPAVDKVDEALKNYSSIAFEEAYKELTVACNTCHMSTNHGFVVIKKPEFSFFPNQDFTKKQEITVKK